MTPRRSFSPSAFPGCATCESRSLGSTSPAIGRSTGRGRPSWPFSTTTRWPRRLVRALRHVFEAEPNVAVCTGQVEPLVAESPGQLLFEVNGGFGRGDNADPAPRRCVATPAWLARPAHRVGCQRGLRLQLRGPARGRPGAWRVRRSARSRVASGRRGRPRSALAGTGSRLAGRVPAPALAWHEHRRDLTAVTARSSAINGRYSRFWASIWPARR